MVDLSPDPAMRGEENPFLCFPFLFLRREESFLLVKTRYTMQLKSMSSIFQLQKLQSISSKKKLQSGSGTNTQVEGAREEDSQQNMVLRTDYFCICLVLGTSTHAQLLVSSGLEKYLHARYMSHPMLTLLH